MNKATFEASLCKRFFAVLALYLWPLFLQATTTSETNILRNDLLKIEAAQILDKMGNELSKKTGIHAYVIATNEHFKERFNLVEYSKQYDKEMIAPYVLFIFAPYATITKKSEARGRVGIIPSSEEVRAMYDYEAVRDEGIGIVAIKDSNTDEDKFNIAVLQAYSELCDNIAAFKGVKLEHTIPDEMGPMVTVLRILVYSGTLIILWLFFLRPFYRRMKYGNTEE